MCVYVCVYSCRKVNVDFDKVMCTHGIYIHIHMGVYVCSRVEK